MVESACGLGCLVLGWFLGSSFLSPPSVFSSLPSTMTWAPCPHGVRTRGKNALLQAVRTFEQSTSKEKATHGEEHMSLTKVGDSSSPSSSESVPQMPVINGEKTQRPAMPSQQEWWISTPPTSYDKGNAQTLSTTVNLFSPFATQ